MKKLVDKLKIKNGFNFYVFKKNFFNSQKDKKIEYKLLTIFEHFKELYILRANIKKNKIELAHLSKNKANPIEISFDKKTKIKNFENWENIKISKFKHKFILTYEIISKQETLTEVWVSTNLFHWSNLKLKKKIKGSLFIISNYNFNQNKIAYFGNKNNIAYYQINSNLNIEKEGETDLKNIENKQTLPASVFLSKDEIILFYYEYNKKNDFNLKVALINKDNPSQLLWHNNLPIWQSKILNKKYYPLGIIKQGGNYKFYCKDQDENLYLIDLPPISYPSKFSEIENHKKLKNSLEPSFRLKKNKKNPILSPQIQNSWESAGSFNPAAIYLDNKFHLIYRATGENGMSVFGYASAKNGFRINKRLAKPVYLPSQSFEFVKNDKLTFKYPYMSGGGWGGCEDPRLSIIKNDIFMTYTAFNGHQAPGVALTSIKIRDFLSQNWKWEKPRLISEPHKIQKNWVIFPEKINGKYAILHSISPQITIDYFDSLNQNDLMIKSHYAPRKTNLKWEKFLRGVGAPPIKTDYGWLVLYHAMDHKNPDQYKLGIMLLDYNNPEKILSCCHKPILEPDEEYENNGKPGVIYVCGAVIKNEKLFVYYGGADKVSCVATAPLKKIFSLLINQPKKLTLKNQSNDR